jgi:uncharacterized membrane protein YphA (DoxX/SURF4 family)
MDGSFGAQLAGELIMRRKLRDLYRWLFQTDRSVTAWMADNGILLLRLSVGIVYFWFGALKFFSGMSPAEDLAQHTIEQLTFGLVPADISIYLLAVWECFIGLGLIFGIYLRATLILLWLQMVGAIMPLFLFPQDVFQVIPIAPTIEGQYIIKNMVIISAGIVIGATVRGGRIVPEPGDAPPKEPDEIMPELLTDPQKE